MAAPYRTACLRIPRFQIVAHLKDDPSLKGKPFAIVSGKGNRAEIYMCSREASRRNVVAGMKVSEAHAVCAELICKEHDEQLYKAAQKKLSRELVSCSPRVSAAEPGIFLLDAGGLKHLGGEHRFCRRVQKVANSTGYGEIHIGVADSTFAATVASRFRRKQVFIVPPGGDRKFLSELSVRHLPISSEFIESMLNLGIKNMGQILDLSRESVAERFGKEGILAYELSAGIDSRFPTLPAQDKEFKCSIDVGGPVEGLNETQFLLKSMLDRLTNQLKDDGLWAEELVISFFNDDDKFDERPIKLLRPSSHAKFLLEVIRLSLESKPLMREFTAVSLVVSRFSKESWEQPALKQTSAGDTSTLHEPDTSDNSPSLTLLLQRFLSRLGEDSVVKSMPNDHHLPDKAGAWVPVASTSSPAVLPVNISYANAHAGPAGLACGLVLRRSRSSAPVLVECKGGMPASITYEGRWYVVKEITEPERLSGLWWEQPIRNSYYIALLEPRSDKSRDHRHAAFAANNCNYLVLLVFDHEESKWSVEGFFD